jgi:phosphate transport system permease protein
VVLLVVLVLLGNVLPLFRNSELSEQRTVTLPTASPSKPVLAFGVDEYSEIAWLVRDDQSIDVVSLLDGALLKSFSPPANATSDKENASARAKVRIAKIDSQQSSALLGLDDGSVRVVLCSINVEFKPDAQMPPEIIESMKAPESMKTAGQSTVVRDGVIYRQMPSGLIRAVAFSNASYLEPIQVFETPIDHIDWTLRSDTSGFGDSQKGFFAVASAGNLALGNIERQAGGIGGKAKQSTTLWRAEPTQNLLNNSGSNSANHGLAGLMISGLGDTLLSIDQAGEMQRWKAEGEDKLVSLGGYKTVTAEKSQLSSSEPLLGRSSWALGNRHGEVETVAITASTSGQELRSIHRVASGLSPVTRIASSPSQRLLAVTGPGSGLKVIHVTSERIVAELNDLKVDEKSRLQFSKTGQEIFLCSDAEMKMLRLNSDFPEASWKSFFEPLWYEGYQGPQHIWQSSTGSIEGETKFGLMPLIFGTLKATFYSMLIAAPIAILAAIFGSEFLSPAWRSRFKPLIELMASVPSVVLGFIGAMVLAPVMRESLFQVLLSVAMTFFLFLFAAHLWMMIPMDRAIPLRRYRLPLMFLVPPIAIYLSHLIASPIERWIFGTNIQRWLTSTQQSSWPGWFLLGLFPAILLVLWLLSSPLQSCLKWCSHQLKCTGRAGWQFVLFIVGSLLVLLSAMLFATILSNFGWDARGTLIGPYQERNALLVGGILGFAIIPLIYTLADDALQSVPQHLRSASLACGATTWQTTTRVVVPTAMSGLFSALMIGFGRAIGETMVVLMAAGNTPLMDVNPFNGYRTLSATLATELPEAARGSTHYHTLFLAALLLFLFTLVANTCAEWVRMRFRKRAFQL